MRQLFYSNTAQQPMIQPVLRKAEAVRSDVVLGSPSARCNGVGICRVMGAGEFPDCPCPRIETLLLPNAEGRIRFAFEKARLSADQFELHFQSGFFQVEEPYRLSPRLCKQLGWKSGWIQPGLYPIWESDQRFIVDFQAPVCQA